MPVVISAEATAEKNKLEGTGVWLTFLEFTYPGEGAIRVVNNTENLSWKGQTWYAANFEVGELKESKDGELPKVKFSFQDPTRILINSIVDFDGAIGAEVVVSIVHSTLLATATPEVEYALEVLDTTISSNNVVAMSLGAENIMNVRSPTYRYIADHCRWKVFKGTECGHVGAEQTCNKTYAQCQAYGNVARFGGFPGLATGGVVA